MPFLSPNQQRQSTENKTYLNSCRSNVAAAYRFSCNVHSVSNHPSQVKHAVIRVGRKAHHDAPWLDGGYFRLSTGYFRVRGDFRLLARYFRLPVDFRLSTGYFRVRGDFQLPAGYFLRAVHDDDVDDVAVVVRDG